MMDPELQLAMIRRDHERMVRDAARSRMASALHAGRPALPRRLLGRLLVRAGLWLMLPSRPVPAQPVDW